jgi:hypothetical protein
VNEKVGLGAALMRREAAETFDAETAAEIAASRLMTPYRARNEERAFAFWSYWRAGGCRHQVRRRGDGARTDQTLSRGSEPLPAAG